MRYSLFLWLICAALRALPLSGQESAAAPLLLTRLGLTLAIDYERGAVRGTARLTVRNVGSGMVSTVPLLLNRLMTVSSVTRRDGAAVPFTQRVEIFRDDSTRQVNYVALRLNQSLATADTATISIQYSGVLVGYTETGSLYIKDHVSRDFTIVREDAYAFPVLGVPSRRASREFPNETFAFSADVIVPAGLTVAMGGEATGIVRGDSLVTWSYRSHQPVPFLNITVAPYDTLVSVGTRIFYFRPDSAGARVVENAVEAAKRWYTRTYGPLDHPSQLSVMEIPEGYGSQASMAAGILQTADAFRDRTELRQLYHELSHLWNVPDLDQPSPRWNEGLASFLQWRLAAQLDGWADWDARLDRTAQTLLRRCASPVHCDSVPMVSYGSAGMTDLSYLTGLLLFYALNEILGSAAFDRAYEQYFQRYRTSGGTTQQLAAAMRAESPKADRILSEWMFSTAWYARLRAGESFRHIVESYR